MTMTRSTARPHVGVRLFARVLVAPESAESLRVLREELVAWLGPHPRVDDAVTVMDELVANALTHGSDLGGLVALVVERLEGGRLRICVRDTGSDAPCDVPPGFGHGLKIVEALSESLSKTNRAHGGLEYQAILAAIPPPISEPDVDLDDLPDTFLLDGVTGGGGRVV